MGRVSGTLYNKFFEGAANDPNGNAIPDSRSIQAAIKGTLVDESQANSKNILSLNSLAIPELFYPKRTSLPIDSNTYKNYPTPDITFSIGNNSYYDETETVVYITGELNYFVGYNIGMTISVYQGTNLQNTANVSNTIYAKSKTFNYQFIGNGTTDPTQDIEVIISSLPFVYVDGSITANKTLSTTLSKTATVNQNGRLYGRFTNFAPTDVTLSTDGTFNISNNTITILTQSTVTGQNLTVNTNNGNYTAVIYRRAAGSNNSWGFDRNYSSTFYANFELFDYYVEVTG